MTDADRAIAGMKAYADLIFHAPRLFAELFPDLHIEQEAWKAQQLGLAPRRMPQ